MEIYGGGPAFPQALAADGLGNLNISYQSVDGAGMSLRDYFAAHALPAAINRELALRDHRIDPGGAFRFDLVAQTAYVMADAMLTERTKAEGR